MHTSTHQVELRLKNHSKTDLNFFDQTALVELRLEQCNGTLTWAPSKDKPSDISPGMKMKYTSGARENITYLDEGFIDLSTLKTVELGYVDMLTVPKQTLLAISNCYRSSSGNSYNAHVQLSLIFGSSLHQNKVVSLFSPNCHNDDHCPHDHDHDHHCRRHHDDLCIKTRLRFSSVRRKLDVHGSDSSPNFR